MEEADNMEFEKASAAQDKLNAKRELHLMLDEDEKE